VLDVGCGSGVLAIAAAKLWRVRVLATDIDPIAVEVARGNCRANGVGPLVRTAVADGLEHPLVRRSGPYDLILANILAAPLITLAPVLSQALARGGCAVLSGLLRDQERWVLSIIGRRVGVRRALREGRGRGVLESRDAQAKAPPASPQAGRMILLNCGSFPRGAAVGWRVKPGHGERTRVVGEARHGERGLGMNKPFQTLMSRATRRTWAAARGFACGAEAARCGWVLIPRSDEHQGSMCLSGRSG
jgi:SAM-dependent methyltransferase